MKTKSRIRNAIGLQLTIIYLLLIWHCGYAQTGNDLWNAYKANPDNHPNIPNCSYAGYRTGNVPLPNPSYTIYNVRNAPFNAVGNGTTDDAVAIQSAIDAAGSAGGGIVLIPEGTYLLNKILHIKQNNVIIRGAGRDVTTLNFSKSLQGIKGDFFTTTMGYNWWWSGGLVWIGPANTFDSSGNVILPEDRAQSWEYWRGGSAITNVSGTATRGAKTITVSNASGLSAGMKVMMVWDNPSDKTLLKHVYGHAPTEGAFDTGEGIGDCSGLVYPKYATFKWTVEIASVAGNQVTLVQPLRIDVRTNWNVRIEQLGAFVTESGIENLRIKGHAQLTYDHLPKPTNSVGGWNGVYINRAWNCWVRNVAVTSMENGVILAAAKNVTVSNVLIDGPQQNHHSLACRVASHDNLFEDFAVNGPRLVKHGVNTEWLSSGNVWSRGVQKVGTFDSHRALSFDLVRTECTVANNNGSGPGGAGDVGPYIGRRGTLWNILEYIDPTYDQVDGSSRNGEDIHEPRQFSMGALVGVRGKPLNTTEGEAMPSGDKGTLVVDDGIVPDIKNLYEAQKNLRMGGVGSPPSTNITSPTNSETFTAGSSITINATASDIDGAISKVEFYSNGYKVGEDTVTPYSIVWNGAAVGSYSLSTKATDNSGASTTSSPVSVTVTPPLRNPENPSNTINGLNYNYFLGNWSTLPDFSTLTATKTGSVATFDLSPKTATNQFAFKYTGFVNVPSDGMYTFYLSSDDGSKLYIGNVEVVDNDGLHASVERSGNIGLKAGKHATTVTYFDQIGGESLTVSYAGPGVSKMVIPATALFRVNTNSAPTATIVSPKSNVTFTTGSTVTISVNASDTDGTIAKVEFYEGSTKLGEDTTAPYTFSWVPAAPEGYVLSAKAVDNGGAATTSATVPIQVTGSQTNPILLALNVGDDLSFNASDGTSYGADAYYIGGNTSQSTNPVSNSNDDALYQSVRYGNFSYAIPISANGSYDIVFKFNETYWTATGKRLFDVKAEATTIISGLDIFQASGGKNIAYDIIRTVSVTDGMLNIKFITLTDNATLSAILIKKTTAQNGRVNPAESFSEMGHKAMQVYPNPVSDELYIVAEGINQITLFNSHGKPVAMSSEKNHILNVSKLPAGIYFLRVDAADGIHSTTIIKEK